MSNEPESVEQSCWIPIYEFAVHVALGVVIFILITIPAVGLSTLIHCLQTFGVDPLIFWGLTTVEYLLFSVDLILFIIFLVSSVWKAGKRLWI